MKRLWSRWNHPRWQDAVFSIGQVVFLIGLLPSVFGPQKPDPLTSLMTAVMLCIFLSVYASYKLWATFALTLLTVGVWFLLAGQVLLG